MGHAHRSSCDVVGKFVTTEGTRDNDGRSLACAGGESFRRLERGSTGEGTLNGLARDYLEEPLLPPKIVRLSHPSRFHFLHR